MESDVIVNYEGNETHQPINGVTVLPTPWKSTRAIPLKLMRLVRSQTTLASKTVQRSTIINDSSIFLIF